MSKKGAQVPEESRSNQVQQMLGDMLQYLKWQKLAGIVENALENNGFEINNNKLVSNKVKYFNY